MADELAGALQRARAERLRRQIEAAKEVQFDKSIDRVTGALADERNVVGSARNPGDKLATARQYYPDAQPYGDDNILFMNPRTGRPTLFNPPGLDVGDVASVTGEISEVMGGIAGGIAGLPAGPVGRAGRRGPRRRCHARSPRPLHEPPVRHAGHARGR
jgi:hypothetical protein